MLRMPARIGFQGELKRERYFCSSLSMLCFFLGRLRNALVDFQESLRYT